MLALFYAYISPKRRLLRTLLISSIQLVALSCSASADQVRISNLSDSSVPLWVTGDPTIIKDVFVCVYLDNTRGKRRSYDITIIGDGPGFLIKSGASNVVYTVLWNDGGEANPGGGKTASVVNNVKLTNRANARIKTDSPANSTDCNGGASPTARLRVTITNTAMDAARDGTFTGTLTLLLSQS